MERPHGNGQAKTTLRIPEDKRQELEDMAAREHRSLNSQILKMIDIGIEATKKEAAAA